MNVREVMTWALKNNIGKKVTISAGYNDTSGTVIKLSKYETIVAIEIDKKFMKYIDIGKIYEITERIEWVGKLN